MEEVTLQVDRKWSSLLCGAFTLPHTVVRVQGHLKTVARCQNKEPHLSSTRTLVPTRRIQLIIFSNGLMNTEDGSYVHLHFSEGGEKNYQEAKGAFKFFRKLPFP